jgi:hypothetical protein
VDDDQIITAAGNAAAAGVIAGSSLNLLIAILPRLIEGGFIAAPAVAVVADGLDRAAATAANLPDAQKELLRHFADHLRQISGSPSA